MFLDDTACNLASLNVMAFRTSPSPLARREGRGEGQVSHDLVEHPPLTLPSPLNRGEGMLATLFDTGSFEHACRLWTIVLEISVLMAQFPSREIAELSYRYRTLGLGYANIGGLLMAVGHSLRQRGGSRDHGRDHRDHDRHRLRHERRDGGGARALRRIRGERGGHAARDPQPPPGGVRRKTDGYEKLATNPVPLDRPACPDKNLNNAARHAWDQAIELGQQHGYRNAQATVIAPTGTIGLVMDCDTTGIEPDFAIVKFKKLAGGGYFKIINQAVPEALRTLGYRESEIAEIEVYAVGHGSLAQAPAINNATLKAKGFTDEVLAKLEAGARHRLRHQVRVQQVDARRGVPNRDAESSGREACRSRPSSCWSISASPRRTSKPPTSTSAGR